MDRKTKNWLFTVVAILALGGGGYGACTAMTDSTDENLTMGDVADPGVDPPDYERPARVFPSHAFQLATVLPDRLDEMTGPGAPVHVVGALPSHRPQGRRAAGAQAQLLALL